MLVKIGNQRINFAHVERIEESGEAIWIHFVGKADCLVVKGDDAKTALAAWDNQAQFQADMQTVNEAGVAQAMAQIRPERKSPILVPGLRGKHS